MVGRVVTSGGTTSVAFELFNVQTGEPLLARDVPVPGQSLRAVAHRIADLVFERLTGIPGAFSTRIAYVSVEGNRAVAALPAAWSPTPTASIRAPWPNRASRSCRRAWSPDGQSLAYVSFETQGLGDLRAAARDRRAPPRVGARGHQRRAGILAGRHAAGDHAVARRQPRHLRARSRDAGADARSPPTTRSTRRPRGHRTGRRSISRPTAPATHRSTAWTSRTRRTPSA